MALVAFDQAFKTTGVAIFNDNNNLVSVETITTNSSAPDEERINQIRENVKRILETTQETYTYDRKVPAVVIEDIQAQKGNISTYKKLAYAQAAIMSTAAEMHTNIYIIPPSSWRSIITKNYNVNFGRDRKTQKAAAQKFVKQYLQDNNLEPAHKITSDIADAICIGLAQIASM